MSTATTTATCATEGIRYLHEGAYATKRVSYVASAHTLGDTIILARIPNHTEVLDVYVQIGTAETAANATVSIGAQSLGSFTGGSGEPRVYASAKATVPYRISFSESNTTQTVDVTISPTSGSWTTTATLRLQLLLDSGVPE